MGLLGKAAVSMAAGPGPLGAIALLSAMGGSDDSAAAQVDKEEKEALEKLQQ